MIYIYPFITPNCITKWLLQPHSELEARRHFFVLCSGVWMATCRLQHYSRNWGLFGVTQSQEPPKIVPTLRPLKVEIIFEVWTISGCQTGPNLCLDIDYNEIPATSLSPVRHAVTLAMTLAVTFTCDLHCNSPHPLCDLATTCQAQQNTTDPNSPRCPTTRVACQEEVQGQGEVGGR